MFREVRLQPDEVTGLPSSMLRVMMFVSCSMLSSSHHRSAQHVVYSLSFAGDGLQSDLESDNAFPLIDARMRSQLQKAYRALISPSDHGAQQLRSRLPPQLDLGSLNSLGHEQIRRKLPPLEQDEEIVSEVDQTMPLPRHAEQISAYKLDKDPRPIVITDTKNPFRIVAVNSAWESLCGYSREECKGRPIGSLLQGPETDLSNVSAMVSKLLTGEEAGTVLTNYTKQGRKFQNNIRVGPVVDEMGKTISKSDIPEDAIICSRFMH